MSASSRLSSLRAKLKIIGGYAMVCDALAIAAVVAALALAHLPWAALVIAWVTMVLVVAPLISARTAKALGMSGTAIGGYTNARALVVLASLAVHVRVGAQVWEAVVLLILAIFVLAERGVRKPVTSSAPVAVNVPGVSIPLPSVPLGTAVFWANTIAVFVALALSPLQIALWPVALVLIAALVLFILVITQIARYRTARARFEENISLIVEQLAPKFAFHWQAPGGTAYQAGMWLPYLDRIGEPYIVLARTAVNVRELAKITDRPIILRTALTDLDAILCPSLTTVFYCNTATRNSHMVRFPELTHIQLNHGDSDKIASASPVFRQFDRNFVAGQAAVDRFEAHGIETRRDQFVLVGRPQLDGVEPARQPIREIDEPVVLYSPTWSGFYEDSDYSSLRAGTEIVEELLARGCAVIFRPHPYARRHKKNARACAEIARILEEDANAHGRAHRWGPVAETEMSIFDCFNASDAMVSDVSSVVSDFLISQKPFAMAAVSSHGDDFVEEFPLSRSAYVFDVADSSTHGLAAALDDMLGEDSLSEVRRAVRSHYLGDATGENCARPFLDAARYYVDGGR